MNARQWFWAWLFVASAVGGAAAFGGGSINPGPGPAGAGGGVSEGQVISGGTANRFVFTNADGGVSTASPALGAAAHLTDTLRVDGNVDIRGVDSNSGSATCDGVGTAGARCIVDAEGLVVRTGGTANQSPLTVYAPAVALSADPAFTVLFDQTDVGWFTIGNVSTNNSQAIPILRGRQSGTGNLSSMYVAGGVLTSVDVNTGAHAVLAFEAGRDNGTPSAPSLSALTARVAFAFKNHTTNVFAINHGGGIGLTHVTPTALSGDVNNYAGCGNAPVCRISGGASDRNVTGIVPGFASAWTSTISEMITVCNVGTTNSIVLVHDSGSSTDVNRFLFNGGTNRTILPESCFPLIYDRASQRHRANNGT